MEDTLDAYREYLENQELADGTRQIYMRYAEFSGNSGSTVKTEKIQKRRSLENVLIAEEYYRMLAAAKDSGRYKYYYIMKTLAQTGIRISELQYFTVEILQGI